MTPLEKMYANIERELLAIVWGAQKFHTYAYGRSVIVETDHKPLESIFRKPLNEIKKIKTLNILHRRLKTLHIKS